MHEPGDHRLNTEKIAAVNRALGYAEYPEKEPAEKDQVPPPGLFTGRTVPPPQTPPANYVPSAAQAVMMGASQNPPEAFPAKAACGPLASSG